VHAATEVLWVLGVSGVGVSQEACPGPRTQVGAAAHHHHCHPHHPRHLHHPHPHHPCRHPAAELPAPCCWPQQDSQGRPGPHAAAAAVLPAEGSCSCAADEAPRPETHWTLAADQASPQLQQQQQPVLQQACPCPPWTASALQQRCTHPAPVRRPELRAAAAATCAAAAAALQPVGLSCRVVSEQQQQQPGRPEPQGEGPVLLLSRVI
jgi:hypothetical protein